MPPEITPSFFSCAVSERCRVEKSVEGSSGSFMSPGTSDTSTNFRTFSDRASAAAALAKALKVRKFALVSDVPGILKDPADPRTLFSTLHLGDLSTLKDEGVISGGMLPKVESCADAIKSGVKKVHLVDGRMAHSLLLEIFTREGVGTEITE